MRIISFIEDPKVIDKIILHLKLTFLAERPPLPTGTLDGSREERRVSLKTSVVAFSRLD